VILWVVAFEVSVLIVGPAIRPIMNVGIIERFKASAEIALISLFFISANG
jgi:hypothetical protein